MMMKRYYAVRGCDDKGDRYATGPLAFVETDDAGQAQRWVHGHGGEVVDIVARRCWTPHTGWFDADEAIEGLVLTGTVPAVA